MFTSANRLRFSFVKFFNNRFRKQFPKSGLIFTAGKSMCHVFCTRCCHNITLLCVQSPESHLEEARFHMFCCSNNSFQNHLSSQCFCTLITVAVLQNAGSVMSFYKLSYHFVTRMLLVKIYTQLIWQKSYCSLLFQWNILLLQLVTCHHRRIC